MFFNYSNFILNSSVREKLYKALTYVQGEDSMLTCWSIQEVKILFLLSNSLSNKYIFFSLLLLLEKLTLNNFSFVLSKNTIANFNVKKNLKVGALVTMRSFNKDQFLKLFFNYSLKKLGNQVIYYNRGLKCFNMNASLMAFGLQKVLFQGPISLNRQDYDLFSVFFENMVYGINIYFFSFFRNYFINRLILSQYGIIVV